MAQPTPRPLLYDLRVAFESTVLALRESMTMTGKPLGHRARGSVQTPAAWTAERLVYDVEEPRQHLAGYQLRHFASVDFGANGTD